MLTFVFFFFFLADVLLDVTCNYCVFHAYEAKLKTWGTGCCPIYAYLDVIGLICLTL